MLAAALLHIYGLPFMYCIQKLLNIYDIYNVFKLTVIIYVNNDLYACTVAYDL